MVVFFIFPIVTFLMNLVGNNIDNMCMTCFSYPIDKATCNFDNNSNSLNNSESQNNNIKLEELENDDSKEKITKSAER